MTIHHDDGYEEARSALYRLNQVAQQARAAGQNTVTLAALEEALTGPALTTVDEPEPVRMYVHRPTRHPMIEYTPDNQQTIMDWLDSSLPQNLVAEGRHLYEVHGDYMIVETAHGPVDMHWRDWLTRDMIGTHYPIAPWIKAIHFYGEGER